LSTIVTQLSITPAPLDQSSSGKSTANTTPDGDGFSAQLARVDADSGKKARSDNAPAKDDSTKGQAPSSGSLASLLAAAGDDAASSVTALPTGQDLKAQTAGTSQAAPSTMSASASFSTAVFALAQAEAAKPQTDTAPQKASPPAPANAQMGKTGDTQTSDVLSTLLSLATSSSMMGAEAASGTGDTSSAKPASRQTDHESNLASADTTGTPSPFTFQNLALSAQAALNALAPSFASATTKGSSSAGQGGSASGTLSQPLAANAKENASSKTLETMLGINVPVQAAAAALGKAADTSAPAVEVIKMDVSHIQAETHLIPAPPAPAQQIADFIVGSGLPGLGASNSDTNQASGGTASASQSQATAPQISVQTVTSPLKVLTLTLEPESLGAVTITMRLNDSGLNVQLDAAQAATASLIEHDKAKITDKLQSLGYAVEGVDVKTAVTVQKMDQTSQGSLSDQSGTMQGQQARQDASSFSSGSGSRNDQAPADGRHESRQSPAQDEPADPTRARSISDGLYV